MERIRAAYYEDAVKVPAVKAGLAAKNARPAPPTPLNKKRGRGRPPGSKPNAKKTKTDGDEEGDGQEDDISSGVRGSRCPPRPPRVALPRG